MREARWILAAALLCAACRATDAGGAPAGTAAPSEAGELRGRAREGLAAGDVAAARAAHEEALARLLATRPEDSTEVQLARLDLAATLEKDGDPLGARALRERALVALERRLGRAHPLVQRARLDLAEGLAAAGESHRARALAARATAELEPVVPADHPDLARARGLLEGAAPLSGAPR